MRNVCIYIQIEDNDVGFRNSTLSCVGALLLPQAETHPDTFSSFNGNVSFSSGKY